MIIFIAQASEYLFIVVNIAISVPEPRNLLLALSHRRGWTPPAVTTSSPCIVSQEERKRRSEELQAKEDAVLERKQAIEADRLARIAHIEDKIKESQAKVHNLKVILGCIL